MSSSHLTWMSVICALALSGCVGRGNVAALESELRLHEERLFAAEQELTDARRETQLARQESNTLRQQLASRGEQGLLPEQAATLNKATGLRFNALLTTGLDRDDAPGDELLSAMVYPHDEEGGVVKLPGTLHLRVVDLAQGDAQQELGSWSYELDESRELWHSGLFAAGYLVEVPWEKFPERNDLTLHARFITPDGREFNAVQQLKVRLPTTELEPPARHPAVGHSTPTKRPETPVVSQVSGTAVRPAVQSTGPRSGAMSPMRSAAYRPGSSDLDGAALPGESSGETLGESLKPRSRDDAPADLEASAPLETSDRWTEENRPRFR